MSTGKEESQRLSKQLEQYGKTIKFNLECIEVRYHAAQLAVYAHATCPTLPTTWRIACSTNRLRPMSWTSGPRQRCPPGKHQQRGAYLIAPPPLHQVGHDSEAHPFTTKGHGVRRTRMMGINVSLSPLISYVLKHYPLAPNPSITRAFDLAPLPLLYHHTHTHTDQRSLALGCTG